ncbi:MAG: MFS transporter [Clostridiales bacterium]|jgi:MFS family permease|nr:MFS transporter [Eubacteriales bacterium]NLO15252.1 MFS transporter [Clostridiales bacterium]
MKKAINPNGPGQAKTTYFAYIWHGFFLALTMSMIDLNTVFPALITELTGSKIIFGLLYTVMLGAPLMFNLLFSHHMKSKRYKKKYLLIGIYLRSLAFLGMALSIRSFGAANPGLAVSLLFVWVFFFSLSAGFAGIAYSDVLAKVIAGKQRVRLYAVKQFFASVASLAGGFLVSKLFSQANLSFPDNYASTLFIGFLGLAVASLGFYLIREPAAETLSETNQNLRAYIREVPAILKRDIRFRRFILVENLTSFSVMALPFYMVYAKEIFSLDSTYVGKYLLIQIAGTILSNLIWGTLAGRTDSRRVVRICIHMGAAVPIIVIFLVRTNADLFGLVFFLVGFIISGRQIGFEPYLLDIAPDQRRTQYLGIRGSLNIFTIILPFMGGLLITWLGYIPVFLLVSLVMLMSGRMSGRKDPVLNDVSSHADT